MKCFSCNQRKGKRYCPAERTQICTRCCGEKRVIEIPCPEDCPHLSSGQTYQALKNYTALLNRTEDLIKRRRLAEALIRFGAFIDLLESEIVLYGSDLRVLADQEVLEAVTILRKTYETEVKGIIFEQQSSNPLVQGLVRALRERVSEEGKEADKSLPGPQELVHILEVIAENIGFHMDFADREGYLQYVRRRHPAGNGGPQSSIVIRP